MIDLLKVSKIKNTIASMNNIIMCFANLMLDSLNPISHGLFHTPISHGGGQKCPPYFLAV